MIQAKEAVAGKVDPAIKRKIEQVAEAEGETVSEIVRRGMKHYVEANPHRYAVLGKQDFVGKMLDDLER